MFKRHLLKINKLPWTLAKLIDMEHKKAFDYRAKKMVTVPHSKVTTGGYPCQDVSMENPNQKHGHSTIADGSMRTGKVFGGIGNYFASENGDEMLFSMLENVAGMLKISKAEVLEGLKNNMEVVLEVLKEKGDLGMCFEALPTHGRSTTDARPTVSTMRASEAPR